ncbi:hypothetical protein A2U01_0108822, partial [Trifolium medium]|nr:hypothetical protein [Trifolium medium]
VVIELVVQKGSVAELVDSEQRRLG